MKKIVTLLVLTTLIFGKLYAQSYLRKNEISVIAFNTINGKKIVLAVDTFKRYIVYRFGTNKNIEFEYPKELNDNYSKFKLFHYFRGGGPQNDGEDINQLHFTNGDFTYKIYDDWHATDDKREVGIIVLNNRTRKQTIIKGLVRTQKGNLNYLSEESNILEVSDEEF